MGDVIVLSVLVGIVLLAVRSILKSRASGGCAGCSKCAHACSCSGNCGGCSAAK